MTSCLEIYCALPNISVGALQDLHFKEIVVIIIESERGHMDSVWPTDEEQTNQARL